MSVWAIGDIHGEKHFLDRLLIRILKEDPSPSLFFLGDYVNRGQDSIGTLQLLAELYNSNIHASFLCGNHDYLLKRLLNAPDKQAVLNFFVKNKEIYNSYLEIVDKFTRLPPVKQLEIACFIQELPVAVSTSDYLFTHSPIPPRKPMPDLNIQDYLATSIKTINIDTYRHISGKTVICGHSRQKHVTICNNAGLILLDTGAGTGRSLSALCLDTLSLSQPVVISVNNYRVYNGKITYVGQRSPLFDLSFSR